MRAIIPAAVLLLIGLVAALPFRRPPTSLADPAKTPWDDVPRARDAVRSVSEVSELGRSGSVHEQALSTGPDIAKVVTVTPPVWPATQSYQEVMVPLSPPAVAWADRTAPLPQPNGRSARWRTGLDLVTAAPPMPPVFESPPLPRSALVQVPSAEPLPEAPAWLAKSEEHPVAVSAVSSRKNDTSSEEAHVLPAPAPERMRHFIREPHR